jgi:hypothetical protein
MWCPFVKTYNVKCRDGSTKTVYKNVDKAFPLFIPGFKANVAAAGDAANLGKAELKAEFASAIQGLLFNLDELNRGLMMNFRVAYVAYQNDPCMNDNFFQREVAKLLDEQQRLRALSLQINALIELAKLRPGDSEAFANALANVIDRIGSNVAFPAATSLRIKEATKIATELAPQKAVMQTESPHEA